MKAWKGVPLFVLAAVGREVPGIDSPLQNGCWRCIGCGRILSPRRGWNQCADCDTREPGEAA